MYKVSIANPKTHHRAILVETLERLEDSKLLKSCEKVVRDDEVFYVYAPEEVRKAYGNRTGYWLVVDEVR